MVKILSKDQINGQDFITSFEGNQYPIYGLMYHPEFAFLNVQSTGHGLQIIKDSKRMQIAHNVSRFLRDEACIRRNQLGGVIDDQ